MNRQKSALDYGFVEPMGWRDFQISFTLPTGAVVYINTRCSEAEARKIADQAIGFAMMCGAEFETN